MEKRFIISEKIWEKLSTNVRNALMQNIQNKPGRLDIISDDKWNVAPIQEREPTMTELATAVHDNVLKDAEKVLPEYINLFQSTESFIKTVKDHNLNFLPGHFTVIIYNLFLDLWDKEKREDKSFQWLSWLDNVVRTGLQVYMMNNAQFREELLKTPTGTQLVLESDKVMKPKFVKKEEENLKV